MDDTRSRVLLTGSTGYVGGRLLLRLIGKGYKVRCLVRDRSRFRLPETGEVEVVEGDVLQPDSLPAAFANVRFAYYLIHSLGAGGNYEERDQRAAENFSRSAAAAQVERIIFLGGLGQPHEGLSPHLRSRQNTGHALRAGGVPVTEFRAGVILGSGSLPFEMVRHITERVPIMLTPPWMNTRCQPISIANVLDYLSEALEVPQSAGQIIEIGGACITTYGDLILTYAKVRGLSRRLISCSFMTAHLSAYLIALIAPVPANMIYPLVEGLRYDVVVSDDLAKRLFPNINPFTCETAIQRILQNIALDKIDTIWSGALSSSPTEQAPSHFTQKEGLLVDEREFSARCSPEVAFRTISCLGGETGWLYFDTLWRLRGLIDGLFGGVGFQRGRRRKQRLDVGDPLDFWRVEAYEEFHLLRLRAELKLPGKAWLQFRVVKQDGDCVIVHMSAIFDAFGFLGNLYWFGLWPFHQLLFNGMMRRLKELMEKNYRDSYDQRIQLHNAYWKRKPLARPLASFRVGDFFFSTHFKAAQHLLVDHKKIVPEMLNVDDFLKDYEQMFQEVQIIGQDGFWVGEPFTGIPWMEAILGCEIVASPSSFVSQPWAKSVNDLERIEFDPENAWFKKYIEFTEKLTKLSGGRFPVGQPILRGIADTLGAIMGQTEMVMAMMEEPDKVHEAMGKIRKIFSRVIAEQYRSIQSFHGGWSIGFYNVWTPRPCIWFQEDLSALLSPSLYRSHLKELNREICLGYDYTAVHLHPVSFFILDDLLEIDELRAIQVNKDIGGPSIAQMIPQFKKIIAAKNLIVWGDLDENDIDCLIRELPNVGLFLNVVSPTLERAKELMQYLRSR